MITTYFTKSLTKALKKYTQLACNVDGESNIYITNGYFGVKLTNDEYNLFVKPVSMREPGNWCIDQNGTQLPKELDIIFAFKRADEDAIYKVEKSPLVFEIPRTRKTDKYSAYYSVEGNFPMAFNPLYSDIIPAGLECKGKDSLSPLVTYNMSGEAIALVCPCKIESETVTRCIRAWFIDSTKESVIAEETTGGRKAKEDKSQSVDSVADEPQNVEPIADNTQENNQEQATATEDPKNAFPRYNLRAFRRPRNQEERLEARKPWLAGYKVEENASADCVIATRESGGKYYLVIFDGTAANPCANYTYRTSEARQREIDRHIKNRSDRMRAKEARKQAKNAKGAYVIDESKPHFKPGDLCTMKYYDDDPWEHTATIRIIKRTACFVTFAHVYGEKEEKPQRVKVSVDQNGEYLSFGSFYYFRADTIEREQESEPAEETAITESENPETGREYIESVAASHPIQKGEPVVTIHWSECPAFQSWKENELKLSVPAADIIFKHFDKRPTDGWCYYKTKYTIDYIQDGEAGNFTDRYDLGDGIGGLIEEVRICRPGLASFLEGFIPSVKVTVAPWATEAIKAIVEQNRAKREDMLDLVELLTDEQLISAVFKTDPANPNVARFFLQQLAKRDEKKALEVFRAWNSGSGVEGLI